MLANCPLYDGHSYIFMLSAAKSENSQENYSMKDKITMKIEKNNKNNNNNSNHININITSHIFVPTSHRYFDCGEIVHSQKQSMHEN